MKKLFSWLGVNKDTELSRDWTTSGNWSRENKILLERCLFGNRKVSSSDCAALKAFNLDYTESQLSEVKEMSFHNQRHLTSNKVKEEFQSFVKYNNYLFDYITKCKDLNNVPEVYGNFCKNVHEIVTCDIFSKMPDKQMEMKLCLVLLKKLQPLKHIKIGKVLIESLNLYLKLIVAKLKEEGKGKDEEQDLPGHDLSSVAMKAVAATVLGGGTIGLGYWATTKTRCPSGTITLFAIIDQVLYKIKPKISQNTKISFCRFVATELFQKSHMDYNKYKKHWFRFVPLTKPNYNMFVRIKNKDKVHTLNTFTLEKSSLVNIPAITPDWEPIM
jgi:hypothetical protein